MQALTVTNIPIYPCLVIELPIQVFWTAVLTIPLASVTLRNGFLYAFPLYSNRKPILSFFSFFPLSLSFSLSLANEYHISLTIFQTRGLFPTYSLPADILFTYNNFRFLILIFPKIFSYIKRRTRTKKEIKKQERRRRRKRRRWRRPKMARCRLKESKTWRAKKKEILPSLMKSRGFGCRFWEEIHHDAGVWLADGFCNVQAIRRA